MSSGRQVVFLETGTASAPGVAVRRWGTQPQAGNGLELARLPSAQQALLPAQEAGLLERSRYGHSIAADAAGNLYTLAGSGIARHRSQPDKVQRAVSQTLVMPRGDVPSDLTSICTSSDGRMFVADAANNRVIALDVRPPLAQVSAVVGEVSTEYGRSARSSALRQPRDVSTDSSGHLYVLDGSPPGLSNVQRLDRWLEAEARFGAAYDAVSITVAPNGGDEQLLVLRPSRGVEEGNFAVVASVPVHGGSERRIELRLPAGPCDPGGIASAGGILYVLDRASGRVETFEGDGRYLGPALGVPTRVAGLSADPGGRILAQGVDGQVFRLITDGEHRAASGRVLVGPFTGGPQTPQWQRIRLDACPLPDGAHFQLVALATDSTDEYQAWERIQAAFAHVGSEDVAAAALSVPRAAQCGGISAVTADCAELFVGVTARALWVGIELLGDGMASATLHELSVEFDRPGWLENLPSIYSIDDTSRDFLQRLLSSFEGVLEEERDRFEVLPAWVDPTARTTAPREWLQWMIGWLGIEPDPNWSVSALARQLKDSFRLARERGSRQALRDLLALRAGVGDPERILVIEPVELASTWWLDQASAVGVDTRLDTEQVAVAAGATGQGSDRHAEEAADPDSAAVLDRTHLPDRDGNGPLLLADAMNRLVVCAYAADFPDNTARAKLTALVEREKPAHMAAQVHLLPADMRVGLRSQLGIDAIVGSVPTRLSLDGSQQLGLDAALLGDTSRLGTLGVSAQLGSSAVVW
jgi:phage tail-like protein